ncbi:MAG: hypothetical protein OQK12_19430 [Motiliproteus sp.]|nr:hypothetical protein [Motiliproteus sp.]
MWLDRLLGETLSTPPASVDNGRYWTDALSITFNGQAKAVSGVLVSDGSESFQLGRTAHKFVAPDRSLEEDVEQFSKVIETLDQDVTHSERLISPLMPAAVIDDQSHLLPFENKLFEVLNKGHFHQISLRPRMDLHYEDEVTDISRAKRLAKGALVHLASHSEHWQRQTLSGVIPKKVLARFSEDDFSIYENRVYARLLDDIERHLRKRIRGLKKLQATLMDAQEFYQTPDRNHRLTTAICNLWGQTFDEAETNKAASLLEHSLNTLGAMLKTVTGLKQTGLYQRVQRNAFVGSSLHLTNILGHDSHYRHLAILWDMLGKVNSNGRKTPEERYERNQQLAIAYSGYAGLALRHALQPYMSGSYEAKWAGRTLKLKQEGLEWALTSSIPDVEKAKDKELLKVVPWFGFTRSHLDVPNHEASDDNCTRIIAWPAMDQVSDHSALDGNWVALSPFDLYCVERFGYLVDRLLSSHVIKDFGQPLTKIPSNVLAFSGRDHTQALHTDSAKNLLVVREALPDKLFADLRQALIDSNAIQQAAKLHLRQQEIIALQTCPVCSARVTLHFQQPSGFRANCDNCRTERYFRDQGNRFVFEQKLEAKIDFRTTGRRSFSCCWTA